VKQNTLYRQHNLKHSLWTLFNDFVSDFNIPVMLKQSYTARLVCQRAIKGSQRVQWTRNVLPETKQMAEFALKW